MSLIKIAGRVRGYFAGNYPENREDEQLHINPRGDQIVVQGLPERSELIRMGASWGAQIPTASAFTFVAAWPTTRSELSLQNTAVATGKTLIIERVWLTNITSMAAAQPISLLGQLVPSSPLPAVIADNTAILRQCLSGIRTNYNGFGALIMAGTSLAVANKWFPLGNAIVPAPTTNLGVSIEANVYGRYLVPPGAAFCTAGLAGTAAGTALIGIEWHEVQLLLTP
jgi:hypothetical protein